MPSRQCVRRVTAGGFLLLLMGCGPTAPVLDVLEPLPAGAPPRMRVTAAQQKERIVAALHAAGVQVSDGDAPYLLRVTLGVDQGRRECGTLNNVRYALRREGRTLLEITAKGWTGTCLPNVFDDASRLLQRHLLDTSTGGPS